MIPQQTALCLWGADDPETRREFVIMQDLAFCARVRAVRRAEGAERELERRRSVDQVINSYKVHERLQPAKKTPVPVIIVEVCAKHELTLAELTSPRRDTKIVAARHEAMWRMSKETSLSLSQIASKLGRRDHTTVLHGIRRYEAALRGKLYRKPQGRVA